MKARRLSGNPLGSRRLSRNGMTKLHSSIDCRVLHSSDEIRGLGRKVEGSRKNLNSYSGSVAGY